jgi:exopolyphosphatase / guanosine-5'-triphosphate,3'-diphosphate pyrophosphatase
MKVAAVDIGTNSMRLLVTDGVAETGRWERVTGLGRGVDRTGVLSAQAMETTLEALGGYRQVIEASGVGRVRAIATSASRDAANREQFFDAVEGVLGVRPDLIPGDEEARLAYVGATAGFEGTEPAMVSDIGGGSTEFVTTDLAVSVDIGSVRLTERAIPSRPAPERELEAARRMVGEMFAGVELPSPGTVIGVAGTWAEIPGLAGVVGDDDDPHGARLTRDQVAGVVVRLAGLGVEETARLTPALRAPVILGGVIIAEAVLDRTGASEVVISIRDSLDGVAAGLLAGDGLP